MRERERYRSRRADHGSPDEPYDQPSPDRHRVPADPDWLWGVIHPHDHAPAAAYEDLVRTAGAALDTGQVYEAAIAFLRAAYLATEIGWKQRGRKLLGRVSELGESSRLGTAQRDRLAALMRCPLFGREPSSGSREGRH